VTLLGAFLASCAVIAAVLGARPRSVVVRRLARLAPRPLLPSRLRSILVSADLVRSGFGWSESDVIRAKLVAALAFGAVAAAVSVVVPFGFAPCLLAAYAGFVLPTLRIERAAARRKEEAERALVTFAEWSEALVASGQPIETAIAAIASRGAGAPLLDQALGSAARSYALGAPLFASLAREATSAGIGPLAGLANELDRSRELGRGALTVLRDERERLRASERARGLDAAGRVEGQLTLVLVLCYLPALMLLVVIPLFLGLLEGMFV